MIDKLNADIKAAVSLIIQEDVSVLKKLFKGSDNLPPKTSLKIKKGNKKKN